MLVTKRNGQTEKVDLDKIHKVLEWAAEGIDVSVSQVEMNAKIQMFDGIKTSDIHDTLIKAAADLISEETPDYQYMAARLAMFQARKQAYKGFQVPHLVGIVKELTDKGLYDPVIAQNYSGNELDELNSLLNHGADMQFSYAAVNQLLSKYLLQDRVTGQLYESPQIMYMMISATLFMAYPKKTRMNYVKRMYEALSNQLISLPTPIMAGLRTPSKQFSSCVLIEAGDSLDSISAASTAIIKYVSQRAGIGLNVGAIRALGSPIRDGEARHTGLVPFLKLFEASVKSCLTPRTKVMERDRGLISIASVKVGDFVLSLRGQESYYTEVEDVWETNVELDQQIDVYLSNGLIIETSKNHPFMVLGTSENLVKVLPLDLKASHEIPSVSGEKTTILKIESGNHPTKFYDITVKGDGMLFAGSDMQVRVAT